jgi:hypothetical protein
MPTNTESESESESKSYADFTRMCVPQQVNCYCPRHAHTDACISMYVHTTDKHTCMHQRHIRIRACRHVMVSVWLQVKCSEFADALIRHM